MSEFVLLPHKYWKYKKSEFSKTTKSTLQDLITDKRSYEFNLINHGDFVKFWNTLPM